MKVGGNASLFWCAVCMFLFWLFLRFLITKDLTWFYLSRRLRRIFRLNIVHHSCSTHSRSFFSSIVIIMIQLPSPLLDSPFLYKIFNLHSLFRRPSTVSVCLSSPFRARPMPHASRMKVASCLYIPALPLSPPFFLKFSFSVIYGLATASQLPLL